MQIITSAQCRAARALLDWSQPELAQRCDIHVQTISNFEKESSAPSKTTLEKIYTVFEYANIEFIGKDGVIKRSSNMKTYSGQQGYWDFYDDIYETIKNEISAREIYVCNVQEDIFTDWLRHKGIPHKQRMMKLLEVNKFTERILVEEGDTHFVVPEYAEYKWMPKAMFSDIPFYIYGKKLAIIIFEKDDVTIYVINDPKITNAYKKQFNVLWQVSKEIPKDLLKVHKRYEDWK